MCLTCQLGTKISNYFDCGGFPFKMLLLTTYCQLEILFFFSSIYIIPNAYCVLYYALSILKKDNTLLLYR